MEPCRVVRRQIERPPLEWSSCQPRLVMPLRIASSYRMVNSSSGRAWTIVRVVAVIMVVVVVSVSDGIL
jgi:hypothetical protein